MELRPYQVDIAKRACNQLMHKNLVYLAMQVRTGKTSTAFETARVFERKNVLFLTKKKAITSIESDYTQFNFNNHFNLLVINYESIHKIDFDPDLLIIDEAHSLGAIPKPSKRAKEIKMRFSTKPIIFLSGTPTPENYSQIYHQFWVSIFSPFKEPNFYKWANRFVNIKKKRVGMYEVNDYTDCRPDAITSISDYFISYTQEQAGFESKITENILFCEIKTTDLINRLIKDRVIEGKEEVILADTGVKLMSKIHQLSSGTIKFESGKSMVIDQSKALFIKQKFEGIKIAIFYVFKEEYEALKIVYGETLTDDIQEFNTTDKNIALQVVSGREGTNLSKAKFIVMYNIQHSATSYWQARDRMTTKDRKENEVFWVFSKGGIEEKIYQVVKDKKSYTLNHFKQDYGIKNSVKNN